MHFNFIIDYLIVPVKLDGMFAMEHELTKEIKNLGENKNFEFKAIFSKS